jgi:hypothetical protein
MEGGSVAPAIFRLGKFFDSLKNFFLQLKLVKGLFTQRDAVV